MPSVHPAVHPPVCGAGGLPPGSSLLPRFPCPRADITAQRRDSRAGDRRTGGQKDARPPWKEETPPATPAPAARTARFGSHPSLPTAPLGKLSHRGRGGKHTAGHCGANLPPSPSLGTTVSPPALRAMPASWSQPSETAPLSAPIPLTPRAGHEPRSKHHPAKRTTDPKLLPVSTPGRDALCTAPCPHPCQLHCRQAQSRGQPRLTSLRGAVPPAPLLTSALLFFFLIIYIYIKPPWLCCALPMAEEEVVAQGVPWHACEHPATPSTCWEEGFLAQMFLTCVIWSPQGSRSHGAGT